MSISVSAQQIQPLYNYSGYAVPDTYYKDTSNDLDTFTGTWVCNQNNTTFTVVLQKKVMMPQDAYFEDALVGAYKYEVDGQVLINTLPTLANNYSNRYKYTLNGNTILGPGDGYCGDCIGTMRKVTLNFSEPDRYAWNDGPEILMVRADADGVEKIFIDFRGTQTAIPLVPEPEYDGYTIPFGTYTLIKQ